MRVTAASRKAFPPPDPAWRVGIVHSSYYPEEVTALVQGAESALRDAGIRGDCVTRYAAPGSFEIPLIGAALAQARKVDALIGLGIIVEGETHHARLIAGEVARGIMEVQIRYGIPFAFEVLHVDALEQARERSRGEGNRGAEAARAVLQSLAELRALRS